jgi:hypothetical protein
MGPMTAQIENFIRAEARGEPHAKILEDVFGLPPGSDRRDIRNAELKMCRWRKRPDFKGIWDDELSIRVRRRVGSAISRIDMQVDSDQEWVANKAANDLIALAKSIGVIKSEESALHVKVEGLPELGTPDGE